MIAAGEHRAIGLEAQSGAQTAVSSSGKSNAGGITPTTVYFSRIKVKLPAKDISIAR